MVDEPNPSAAPAGDDAEDALWRFEERARYALVATLTHGRRVLDMGRLTAGPDARSVAALHASGADRVVALAPNLEALRRELALHDGAAVEVRAATLPLPFDYGAFDVLVAFDLLERAAVDARWSSEARRVLSRGGCLVVAVRGETGPTLGALGGASPAVAPDAVAQAFAVLAESFGPGVVFGQAPLVGGLFYDFEVDDLEPEIDRSLLPDEAEAPGWYVLVFGPGAAHSDKLTLVQLPFTEVAAQVRAASAAEREVATRRADALLGELDAERAELRHQRAEIEQQRDELRALREERDELTHELAGARTVTEQLASNLRVATDELDAREAAGITGERFAELATQVSALGEERERLRRDTEAKAQELEHVDAQLDEAHEQLQLVRDEATRAETRVTELVARVGGLEAALVAAQTLAQEGASERDRAKARAEQLEQEVERGLAADAEAREAARLDVALRLEQSLDRVGEQATEIAELRRRVADVERERERALDDLRRNAAALEEWLAESEARRLRDIDAVRREAEVHIGAAKQAADAQLAAARDAALGEVQRLRAEHAAAERAWGLERDGLVAELERASSAADQRDREVAEHAAAAARRELQEAVARYEGRLQQLESELDRHRHERTGLERQLGELSKESAERSEAQGRLQDLLEQLRAQHQEELQGLREQLEQERMSNVEATEALRQERVRGEQLLARLLQLENEQQSLD